jgi:hypothetical protein
MGVKDNASLALIPAAYKTSKVYSAIPTDGDGDFTFSRSGNATRVNKAGLVETIGTNVPRLNYDLTNGTPASCPSLLLEPTSINRVFPNNSLTGYSTIGVSTTNNSATSPNGANEGAKVQATTSGTAVVFKGFTGTSGVTHNISAFVKAGTHNQVRLQEGFSSSYIDVNLTNGTEVSSQNATNKKIEEYPNGWYRVSFNFTTSGTNLQFAVYFNGTYLSGENIYLYGGQIEEGSYATSLIPTTGSAVTRTVDTCKLENFANMPTDYPFTVFLEGRIDDINTNQTAFSILDISSTTKYLTFVFANTGFFQIQRRNVNFDIDSQTFPMSVGDVLKIAIAFTSNTTYKCYINGSLERNETSGLDVDFDFNDILIGQLRVVSDTGTRNQASQFMLFNEALTDAELIALTT